MISASFYILVCSAKNRFRVRLQRLREPRYLIGAIAGVAYFYFSFFARMRGRARAVSARGRAAPDARSGPSPLLMQAGGGILGLVFFAGAALGWVLPFSSAMLDFTDAEIQFLFPAPVPRRDLLVHRLMRSQLGFLFTALIAAFAVPSAAWPGRLRFAIGTWVILVTTRVYYTGVWLARSRFTLRAGGSRNAAWVPLALVLVGVAIVAGSFIREFGANPPAGLDDLIVRGNRVLTSGAAHIVLWPFMTLTRPLFAPSAGSFITASLWALAILVVTFTWVLQADEAMQEMAAQVVDRREAASRVPSARTVRARATPLTLAPRGGSEGVFFWKNGVQTLRAGGVTLVRYVMPLVVLVAAMISMTFSATHASGAAAAAGLVAMGMAAFVSVLGPQIVRTDLRSDLRHLELLKTWPVEPAAVVRGEMLWPVTLLTAIAWLAITCAAMFSAAAFPRMTAGTRLSYGASAIIVAPTLVLAQYLVQNAVALLFPAWIPQGDQRPRGVDAMGQRLVMLGGVMLSVAILFTPGVLLGGIVWLALRSFLGSAALVPAAAVCSVVVALEVLVSTEALGPVYERLDVTAVERAE